MTAASITGCTLLAGTYGSPAPIDEVVESVSGDDFLSLAAPNEAGSRLEPGVSGRPEDEGVERRPEWSREGRRMKDSPDGGDRTEGQSDLSVGSARPCPGSRCARMAAAYERSQQTKPSDVSGITNLEHLDLLMLAHRQLSGLLPVRAVFPSVFDEARRMPVLLRGVRSARPDDTTQHRSPCCKSHT